MAEISRSAKGTRIVGESRAQMRSVLMSMYESGASIRSLARETGRSYGFIRNVLTESDVALRGRGGAQRRNP